MNTNLDKLFDKVDEKTASAFADVLLPVRPDAGEKKKVESRVLSAAGGKKRRALRPWHAVIAACLVVAVTLGAVFAPSMFGNGRRGCVNQQPMRAYWDGNVFIVENGNPNIKEQSYPNNLRMTFPNLDFFEYNFKNYSEYCGSDLPSQMIVRAKKSSSKSCFDTKNNRGMTYTDISISEILWSSNIAENYTILQIDEAYYYKNNDGNNLEFIENLFQPPTIILNEDADYYILYLFKAGSDNLSPVHGDNWYISAGFKVNSSTRAAVANGVNPEGKGIGRYSHLYKEVFEKYVD